MKQIVCGICNDFRALHPKGSVTCRCGNVIGWWVDPHRGIAKLKAKYKGDVRVIGLHNAFLKYAFHEPSNGERHTQKEWRDFHTLVTEHLSTDSLFNKDRRCCPLVFFRVGETNDVSWAADDEQPPEVKDGNEESKEKVGPEEG